MTMSTSIRHWLNSPPLCWFRADLKVPSCALIRKGDEHGQAEDWDKAIGCFEEAINQAEQKRNWRVKGIALLHLAEAHRARKEMDHALSFYEKAVDIFRKLGDDHNQAAACRMAAILCHNSSQYQQALSWYEKALRILTDSCQRHTELGNHGRAAQYRAWCQDIQMRIEESQSLYQPKAKPEIHILPKAAPHDVTEKTLGEAAILQLMPVLGQIPAGVPLYVLLEAKGNYVACSELLIDDIPYQLQSLERRLATTIRMEEGFKHFVLKVTGDSMIQAGLEEGDYVIMKAKEAKALEPKDGDIVAALIKDQDDEATLKRFRRIDKDTIVLEPENPDYPSFEFAERNSAKRDEGDSVERTEEDSVEFTEGDPEVLIMGIAIAILKRSDQQDPLISSKI